MAKESSGAKSIPGRKHRLGELMMEYGYISEEQLETALKRQMHDGGQLGSILIDMGYIGVDDLLKFLGKHFEVKPEPVQHQYLPACARHDPPGEDAHLEGPSGAS